MEKLIDKNVSLQNRGVSEEDGWLLMLKKAQTKLFNAYKKRDVETIDIVQKDIDFIQRQLIRLSQR